MTVYSLGYCVMRKNLALFFLPSLLPYTNVWGEELQDATLKEVVVTATRAERLLEDAPVRTEVINRQELQRTHAKTLTEALANVSGLVLRPIIGKSGYEVSLQGLSGDQVLVLIDGLPITATTGSTVDVSQLTVTDIERVEIVKGAMSAQYGSAAMGGVVNVITRAPTKGLRLHALTDMGSYGNQSTQGSSSQLDSHHVASSIEGGQRQWQVRANIDYLSSQGFDAEPNTWPQLGDKIERKHHDMALLWSANPTWQTRLGLAHYQEQNTSFFQQALPAQVLNQSKQEEQTRTRLTAAQTIKLAQNWRVDWQGLNETLTGNTHKSYQGNDFDNRHTKQTLQHVNIALSSPSVSSANWGEHLLQIGHDSRAESLTQHKDSNSELLGNTKAARNAIEFFIQDDWFIPSNWELVTGLRHQTDSDFGQHLAPKINLSKKISHATGEHTIRFAWGKGYRVPNLKERHYLFDHSNLGYVIIGNPQLQPEESSSWQFGWHVKKGKLSLDSNLFFNDVKNLIQVDQLNAAVINGISQFEYQNIAKAHTKGIELGLEWRVLATLKLSTQYSLLNATDTTTQLELTRQPRHQSRLAVDWNISPKQELSLRLRAQSDELASSANLARSPAWHQLDISSNHRLSPELTLFAGINNVTGTQRDASDPYDFRPLANTYGYIGLRYQWQKNH